MSRLYSREFVENFLLRRKIKLHGMFEKALQKLDVECLVCGFRDAQRWRPTFNKIKCSNTGCPRCSKNLRWTLIEVYEFLLKKNIKLLSDVYENTHQKLDVECLVCGFCDKSWCPTFNHIRHDNSGCPICCTGKSQKKLLNIMKLIFPQFIVHYNFCDFSWLKTGKARGRELDLYIPKLKIAIEFDGEQHFKPIKHFGGIEKFRKTQQLDQIKNKLILEHPESVKYFIRIPYWEPITEENVKRILKENGVLNETNS